MWSGKRRKTVFIANVFIKMKLDLDNKSSHFIFLHFDFLRFCYRGSTRWTSALSRAATDEFFLPTFVSFISSNIYDGKPRVLKTINRSRQKMYTEQLKSI